MKIERFEDVLAWQRARKLVNLVYDVTNNSRFAKDFRLCNQIRGAAGSAMHNVAEGFDAGSDAEFIRFLRYTRRSASEIQSQLYIARDRQYITEQQFNQIYNKANEVKRVTNGFIAYLKQSR